MKGNYSIMEISRDRAMCFLANHHYLSQLGNGLVSICNIGCFDNGMNLVGVVCYNHISSPETLVGCFGLDRNADQSGYLELVRLSMDDSRKEKNLTSWFVSRSIRYIRTKYDPCALISYADSKYHCGYIYQATNFKYYGMTAKKHDFVVNGKVQQRGKTKGVEGKWIDRSRKHRYAMWFKGNPILWKEEEFPKQQNNEMQFVNKSVQGYFAI